MSIYGFKTEFRGKTGIPRRRGAIFKTSLEIRRRSLGILGRALQKKKNLKDILT
jgi:hypothetical protein